MYIKPKDLIEFILFAFAFVALILIAGYLEAAPITVAIWIAVALGIFLWIVWIGLVIRDRNREARAPKLKMMRNGQWVDVEFLESNHAPTKLFDQDEAAIHHLDFNKEQA